MASKKSETIKIEPPTPRSPMLEALRKRHGCGIKIMKDRRTPRGGSKRPDHHEGW